MTHRNAIPLATSYGLELPGVKMAFDDSSRTNSPSSESGFLLSRKESRKLRPLSLRQGFSWSLIGSLVHSGSRWAVVAAFAKLGTPELVGQYALGLALTNPVVVLAMLNLRAVQVTDARSQYALGDYLGLRLAAMLVALGVTAVLAAAGDYNSATRLTILAVGVAGAVDAISDIYYGQFQKCDRMDFAGVSMSLKAILFLGAAAAVLYLTGSVGWAVTAGTTGVVAVLLGYDLPAASAAEEDGSALMPRLRGAVFARLIWLILPLGLTALMGSLQINIARFFIAQTLGERELGLFAACASVVTVGQMLTAALQAPIVPRLAQHHAEGEYLAFDALFGKTILANVLIGGLMVLGALVVGRQALTLLYTAEYAHDHTVFMWLIAGGAVSHVGVVMGIRMSAARLFSVQLPLATAIMGVAALSAWWLVPAYGLQGAAMSSVLTAVAQLVLYFVVSSYLLKRERRRLNGIVNGGSSEEYLGLILAEQNSENTPGV